MTQVLLATNSTPRWVGTSTERLLAAQGNPARVKRVLDSSPVPMVIIDNERRYIDANAPARLAVRLTLAELRRLRVDDLTPPDLLPTMNAVWGELCETGFVSGRYRVALRDASRLEVVYFALAEALPGLHLGAFAPADWPEEELLSEFQQRGAPGVTRLTARELEVLELAAEGRSAPMIALDLGVSVATVRTHFGHIYEKLEVGDRASAVAKALRLRMIS